MRTRSIATTKPLHGCLRTQIFGAVTTQLTCPSCRGEIPTGAAFCPACGTPSPTVISNERAAASPPPPPPRAGEHVPDRMARALGRKYQRKALVGRGRVARGYELWDPGLHSRDPSKVLP